MRRELATAMVAMMFVIPNAVTDRLGLGERRARACGPDFPVDLLSDRAATLGELPEGVFADEVAALVPAPDHPYTVVLEDEPGGYLRTVGSDAERALYDQGAAAFRAKEFAIARARFTALLALPPAERRHRSTWAAYMLGRIAFDRFEDAAAIAWNQRVRALVADGYLDERGLAAASLGQEAWAWMRREPAVPGATTTAIRLYAEQAANGHPGGVDSLLIVVRGEVERGDEAELFADPIGQRLVAAYLYARADEMTDDTRARVWRELAALPQVAGADRLAAAAYRDGMWDLAAQLASRAPDAPLAAWVRAKLALRAGDPSAADRLLAAASAGADPIATARVCGERAALALGDGRMVDAMTHAWAARARYPIDAYYIAERVLTIAELTAFVETHADDETPVVEPEFAPLDVPALRALLARRLMRDGDHAGALPYFAPSDRVRARVFAGAMERAALATDPIDRARAWFDASVAARVDGLEILGTSLAPDWAVFGAQYGGGDVGYASAAAAGAAEQRRVDASAPIVTPRYHYRYLASALAERAAEALPHQSQAFAAALCRAALDIRNVDDARVQRLYRRYVAVGPSVDFAGSFGETCPEPEFERARRFLPRDGHGPRALAILGLLAAVLGGAVLARWLRRVVPIAP
ncbi:MAG: hypothetical protein K8W52_37245 [Deltaproteobacteria bacterium]|nr:hypothetical protein [Deltaproteobacteria bacterium]